MTDEFLTLFNFEVQLVPSGRSGDEGLTRGAAAFSEVTGLEIELERTQIREGGFNSGQRQLVGKTTHPVLVLKRGLTLDLGFWTWVQSCFSGSYPMPYIAGTVSVYPPTGALAGDPPAVWRFSNGIAVKVKADDLKATGASQVPIEELHIAHEGLQRTA